MPPGVRSSGAPALRARFGARERGGSAATGQGADDHAGAKAWLMSLACDLWTTRLLARQARESAPGGGHECLANLVQGTVCKIAFARPIDHARVIGPTPGVENSDLRVRPAP